MRPTPHIREARDTDGPAIIDIVQQVFSHYPGCILDLTEMPDLTSFATSTRTRNGRAFVAELDIGNERQVVGCVAIEPSPNGFELHRLYVHPAHWGAAIGHALMNAAEAEARSRGAKSIELWSDVKFDRAHRFYERRGYHRHAQQRELHDRSQTIELYFRRDL